MQEKTWAFERKQFNPYLLQSPIVGGSMQSVLSALLLSVINSCTTVILKSYAYLFELNIQIHNFVRQTLITVAVANLTFVQNGRSIEKYILFEL